MGLDEPQRPPVAVHAVRAGAGGGDRGDQVERRQDRTPGAVVGARLAAQPADRGVQGRRAQRAQLGYAGRAGEGDHALVREDRRPAARELGRHRARRSGQQRRERHPDQRAPQHLRDRTRGVGCIAVPEVNPAEIDRYCEEHTTPPPAWLEELARETRETLETPQMLTGRVEGRLLQMLVWASEARRVLEIGTYSGYSALSMAAALPEGGRLITCEIGGERAAFAQRHIDASPYADRIEVRLGPALDTIRELDGPFDLVFIDADKPAYADYYEATLPLLSPRGLIVIDNTLWSGRVLDPEAGDDNSRTLAALNDRLVADERVVTVLLPVRDGVTLLRRA
jgi:caffeoyl-CoA O-methyltransferase